MLELLVILLCGSIVGSGILAVRLDNLMSAMVSAGLASLFAVGLLRAAGRAGRRDGGGSDRLRPVDPDLPLRHPQDRQDAKE